MGIQIGDIDITRNARGVITYRIELWHRDLNKHRVIRGNDRDIVARKADLQIEEWKKRWAAVEEREARKREQEKRKSHVEAQKDIAASRSAQAAAELENIERILEHTLSVNDVVDWEGLKDHSSFSVPAPVPQERPEPPSIPPLPRKPLPSDEIYQPQLSIFDKLIRSRGERKVDQAVERYQQELSAWESEAESVRSEGARLMRVYEGTIARIKKEDAEALKRWETKKNDFVAQQHSSNAAIDEQKKLYEAIDPDAIVSYSDIVLSHSKYPEWMSPEWELEFHPMTGLLIVEYNLPDIESLPTLSDVRYVISRDELVEKHIAASRLNSLYDSLVYQIALRTIHELYEADVVESLKAIVFNGWVTSLDRSSGHETTACILSFQAERNEFLSINLANVDPKACFKSLKGVGSSKLHSLTPVAPIVQMQRDDGRFVAGRDVAATMNDSTNLAAMHWEDFEHLIRELFEQEFASGGSEVRVTQASRDGGVDAIVFDPDPIRGGKIVIQAKRYTNTVGVSAVRDLYGTVVNEGANRGILVTTSDYGPDAYAFAKDKPISLLSGANLLHLLEKHGQRAKIDIAEAREQLRYD